MKAKPDYSTTIKTLKNKNINLIFLLLSYLVFHSFALVPKNNCGRDCKRCSLKVGRIDCFECEQGYKLIDRKCKTCNLEGCGSCSEFIFICQTCAHGWFNSTKKENGAYSYVTKCSKCPKNCKKCSSSTTCEQCFEDFMLDESDNSCNVTNNWIWKIILIGSLVILMLITTLVVVKFGFFDEDNWDGHIKVADMEVEKQVEEDEEDGPEVAGKEGEEGEEGDDDDDEEYEVEYEYEEGESGEEEGYDEDGVYEVEYEYEEESEESESREAGSRGSKQQIIKGNRHEDETPSYAHKSTDGRSKREDVQGRGGAGPRGPNMQSHHKHLVPNDYHKPQKFDSDSMNSSSDQNVIKRHDY